MASPACASGSFQAGQGQYAGDEGGVKAAQLGVAIDAARIANMKIRRIGFPQSRREPYSQETYVRQGVQRQSDEVVRLYFAADGCKRDPRP